ncbi:MAG TPA: GMC family oxidoreductase N-terminal domain-containing protein [Gaiellales bacterium]|nr:GMC family oxidoreductase N-terminal domain-containing protein [Gaiellales bacterium]
MQDLPQRADTLIVGGGTTGAALAGLLAERSDESIVVLEGGPDFGPYGDGGWPADVLDATWLAESHQLGYGSDDGYRGRRVEFERAGMIGGCSSHNGCAAIWGSRLDYDAFAAAGLDGWSRDEVEPLLRAASERMRVRIPEEPELAPFHRAALASLLALGAPRVRDLNDLDTDTGVAPSPVNIADGVRWNSALAYLDPVRERPSLRIYGNAPAERLIVEGGRVRGAVLRRAGAPVVEAGRVIVCAGAYDSPALLLRSGIGPAGELRALGIAVVADLPGVGANLHDHPAIELAFAGSPELRSACADYAAGGAFAPVEGVIAKLRSIHCAPDGFDLHVYPVGGIERAGPAFWIAVACLTPRSRGRLRLAAASGDVAPLIDHAYCSDPDGHDHAVLRDGAEIARALARSGPFAQLLGNESQATAGLAPGDAVDAVVAHYYHPAGTCAMGTVVDERLRVHGIDGLFVADCSVFPVVPRANTCLPAVLVAHRLAGWL